MSAPVLDQIAAARAALDARPVAMFYIPTDERLAAQENSDGLFEDVAAVGFITLTYGELREVGRRAGEDSEAAVHLSIQKALRAVVIGGPFTKQVVAEDGTTSVDLIKPQENPTSPTRLVSAQDAIKIVTRMHPAIYERAVVAFASLHAAKEANTKDFLDSKTIIVG